MPDGLLSPPPCAFRLPGILELCGLLTKIIFFFFFGSSAPDAFDGSAGFFFSPGFTVSAAFPAFSTFTALSAFTVLSVFTAFCVFPALSVFTAFCVFPAFSGFTAVSALSASFPPAAAFSILPAFTPKCLRASPMASSSMELCATFTSYPLPCKKAMISLLCTSSSSASLNTFIFAMLLPPSNA